MARITLFQNMVEIEKEGKKLTFPRFYARLGEQGYTVNVGFKSEVVAKLNSDIKSKVSYGKFPCDIILEDKDYFFTLDTYTKDGVEYTTDKLVIKDYQDVTDATLKSMTIEEYVEKRSQQELDEAVEYVSKNEE